MGGVGGWWCERGGGVWVESVCGESGFLVVWVGAVLDVGERADTQGSWLCGWEWCTGTFCAQGDVLRRR